MIDRCLLRYFLAVVDHGTFSRAAAQCGVSQPTLSVGIAKLERLLGHLLFERTNRRVEVTDAGARLVTHARRIEAEFAEAERTVRDDPPARLVRFGIAPSLPASWIERALIAARGAGAGERFELVAGRMSELAPKLDRGRIDAILGPLSGGASGLTLFTEGYGMAMAVDHPLATEPAVTPEQLAGEPMIVRQHCEMLSLTSRFFTSRGVRPFMSARTTSDEMAAAYVRAHLGITLMPRCYQGEGIAMAALAGFDATRTIGVRIAPGGEGRLSESPAVVALCEALVMLHETGG